MIILHGYGSFKWLPYHNVIDIDVRFLNIVVSSYTDVNISLANV